MLLIKRNVKESFTLRVPPDSGPQVVGVKIVEVYSRFDPRVLVAVDCAIRTLASYREGGLIRIVIPNRNYQQEIRVSLIEGEFAGYSARIGISANRCVHVLRDELEREENGKSNSDSKLGIPEDTDTSGLSGD